MIFSFVKSSEGGEVLAFHEAMAACVKDLVQILAPGQMHLPSGTIVSVRVAEERIDIPYRVYCDKQQLLKAMNAPGDTARIALCLGRGITMDSCVSIVFGACWTLMRIGWRLLSCSCWAST